MRTLSLSVFAWSAPLQLGHESVGVVRLAGDVKRFEVTPDGARAVYLTDAATAGAQELWSVATDGRSVPVRLSEDLLGPVDEFRLSPDGARVAYRGDRDELGTDQLFIVPADGSAAPLELNGPLVSGGGVVSLKFSSDGSHLVYRARQDSLDHYEVYGVRADGSLPAVKLNAPLDPGENVTGEAITPDGNTVVFRAPQASVQRNHAVPIDGSASAIDLDTAAELSRFTSDSSLAVYQDSNGSTVVKLYSIALDGSSPPLLLSSTTGYVARFELTADDVHAVFVAQQPNLELFSVPPTGGVPVALTPSLTTEQDVGTEFSLTPDGSRVVYVADQLTEGRFELFVVPVDASGPAQRISQTLTNAGDVLGLLVDPTGARALYVAYFNSAHVDELFSVPVSGGAVTRISGPMVANGDVVTSADGMGAFRPVAAIDALGREVLYLADQDQDQVFELFRAPIDGRAPPRKVNGALVAGGDVQSDFRYGRGRQVLFRADASTDGTFELFVARTKALRTD